jgi:hypothetical protein
LRALEFQSFPALKTKLGSLFIVKLAFWALHSFSKYIRGQFVDAATLKREKMQRYRPAGRIKSLMKWREKQLEAGM